MLGNVKLIGFFGSESIGKTTTALQVVGKLRSLDVLADTTPDTSSLVSFQPELFDLNDAAWASAISRKMHNEAEASLRRGVNVLVSDRTPWDLAQYGVFQHPASRLLRALEVAARAWLENYDLLFYFPLAGTRYRADGYREESDGRRVALGEVFDGLVGALAQTHPGLMIAAGSYSDRTAFVFQKVAAFLGMRQADSVRALDEHCGRLWPGARVVPRGSRAVASLRSPQESSDLDVTILIPAAAYATRPIRDDSFAETLSAIACCSVDAIVEVV